MDAPVVIAGAGPNGLMLAAELAAHGVTPVVIEKLTATSREPRANGMVGQVVRVMDQRGLYERCTGQSAPPRPQPRFFFGAMPLDQSGVDQNSLYTMGAPQYKMETELQGWARERGVEVRRGHRMTGQTDDGEGVTVEVTGPDGAYSLRADYLVAADGGSSPTRKALGIEFPGATAPLLSRVANVRIPREWIGPDASLRVPGRPVVPHGWNRTDNGLFVFGLTNPEAPVVGTNEWVEDPSDLDTPLSLEELSDSAERVLGYPIPLQWPDGDGPYLRRKNFGVNTRLADRYRVGRIFLVGDAAHVHGAAGGPGLNLGIQDAVNLGWKLAAVLTGRADAALLDTYETERRPVAERVMTQTLAQQALSAPGPRVTALRKVFGELLERPDNAQFVGDLMSAADTRYDMGGADHPLVGGFVPAFTLDDGRGVDRLLPAGRAVLLCLNGCDLELPVWKDTVEVVRAEVSDAPAAALLIRPDGFVAWAGDDNDDTGLTEALNTWFGAPTLEEQL
ncbi:MAG TPA: FAD-dependent monooxygenase [Stackebrandtia sp.]|jgi:2-polyprenyl-6-methoxyphenol hydroxylase-like FAD-dependent oxidoreductase|uniref:FAD-dependent monooxygenase n=1 Tax=Stackebrandtia sp. TaxID=2023065 RepID=UPI002D3D56A3|nr:FAD-dependent monooxygenase [Stackebrandtia sp.]HZE38317.1 FAD-dependent monooxygenase [Stackebrandtia sp.]